MEKNQELIGTVSVTGSSGEGIIKQDGLTIFVPFALAGEKVRYKVLKVKSNLVYAKLLEVLTPSEIRVRPKCSVFTKCGGCQLQHVKYCHQLVIKEEGIKVTFRKVAGLDVDVKKTMQGDDCFRYRNKLQLPVAHSPEGAKIGFYAENSHRVVEISDCLINATWTKDIIAIFNKYISNFGLLGYDETKNSGDIREITVKEIKGKLIITIVALKPILPKINTLIEYLKEGLNTEFSLYLNVNAKNTNVIYSNDFRLLYGKADYADEMFGIKYKIGVQSFMQVNSSVCAKLYSAVKTLVNADNETVVIDAYSGAGLMTALLATNAKKAIGIEIVAEAVDCANQLAVMNKLDDKITNYLGKCEDILPNLIKKEKEQNSKICLVLDPPRKGCDIKVIKSIIASDIEKIVYVSCKPSTLARDVGLLVGTLQEKDGEIVRVENPKHRYTIDYVRPFDMFAQTKHVETLVCLKRNKD